jgi:hypothetical protein
MPPNRRILAWPAVFPSLIFIVVQIVYRADRPVRTQQVVEDFAGFVFYRIILDVGIAFLAAWIAYRLSGRSRLFGTITFSLVLALFCVAIVWRSKLAEKASLSLPSGRADPPYQATAAKIVESISPTSDKPAQ